MKNKPNNTHILREHYQQPKRKQHPGRAGATSSHLFLCVRVLGQVSRLGNMLPNEFCQKEFVYWESVPFGCNAKR